MPANVETMAYAKLLERDVPWHGLGTPIDHAMTWEEAIVAAQMKWKAFFAPVEAVIPSASGMFVTRKPIPHRFAIVRDSDHMVLGVVSDDYRIVQNEEAFAFTNELLGMGVRYETAGVIINPTNGNVKTWVLAKTDHVTVLGDRIDPYVAFVNSFDGHTSMIAAMTPVRVVCQNTLTAALGRASRTWTIKHTGNIQEKIEEAKMSLGLMNDYMAEFPEFAEKLNAINLYNDEVTKFLDELFPAPTEGDTQRRKDSREYLKGFIRNRFEETPDLVKFRGTGWALYNATVDVITHKNPMRRTKNWRENRFMNVVDGHAIVQRAQALLMKVRV